MYNKSVLDNGVRVVTEHLPARTVSCGIWIDVGSRDEPPSCDGIAHFVEHMLFKGTPSRKAAEIARVLDNLGGMSNAFTSKENTCLYGTVVDSQLSHFLSLLSDLFLNSLYGHTELEVERQVILQEINMIEDSPEELISDIFADLIWKGHPFGKPVIGSPEVVSSLTGRQLKQFVRDFYVPERIVIAAAGNVDHHELVNGLTELFSNFTKKDSGRVIDPPRRAPQPLSPKMIVKPKDLEQAHILLGTPCPSATAKERYTLALLNILLGGNMSSKLFQEIREKRGLAYSIYSFIDANSDCGSMNIYAGVGAEAINEVVELINGVLAGLSQTGVSETELTGTCDCAKAGLLLAVESMEARMMRLAKNELYFGRYITIDEVDNALTNITSDDIAGLAAQIFADPLSGVVLGPVADDFTL